MSHPIVVAITGASGASYGLRVLNLLLNNGINVHLTISPSGAQVIKQELGRSVDLKNFSIRDLLPGDVRGKHHYHHYTDFMTPIASGSFKTSGMVIVPCSGSSLAAIAAGTSNNLIHRAADVHLKEGRKLILVPREAPLSLIHLENMKAVSQAGATVLPASPGWYHGVRTVDDLVDFVVGRILDQLGLDHSLITRWGESPTESKSTQETSQTQPTDVTQAAESKPAYEYTANQATTNDNPTKNTAGANSSSDKKANVEEQETQNSRESNS